MKKAFTIIILLLLTLSIQAQRKQLKSDFRIGAGGTFIETNKITGGTFYNAYNYYLHKNFSVEPSLNFTYGEKTEGTNFLTATYLNADANMYFIPLPYYPAARFKVGFGASTSYMSNLLTENMGNVTLKKELTFGSVFVAAWDINIGRKAVIGLKAAHYRYQNKEINTTVGFNAGFRF